MSTIADILDGLTVPGSLYEALEDGALGCTACAHRCLIKPGRRGICKVRFNEDGVLKVPYGYVAALQADPVEKKPFFHLFPGVDALTFGMLGCDFHCGYCQNWVTSQMMRDPASDQAAALVRPMTPRRLGELALLSGAGVVVSSYNEPLITSEWAAAVFEEMQRLGLPCAYVSNGNMTPEVLAYIRPYLTGYKVDLKSMRDKPYRELGGVLQNILDGIRMAKESGLWVEVVTLVVPGFNDSPEELWDAASYLHSVSPDIPWHVTAFHPDYKMTDPEPTSMRSLRQAAEIGQEAGLNYVYAGNLPGQDNELEHTHCPNCRARLIERFGYTLLSYHITPEGSCPKCGTKIPGVWPSDPHSVRIGGPGYPKRV